MYVFLGSPRFARRSAVKVFGGALETVTNHLTKKECPDEEERRIFASKVYADIANTNYHLYTISYPPSPRKLL